MELQIINQAPVLSCYKSLFVRPGHILYVIWNDVLQASDPLQLCAGKPAGCEATIYAMRAVFDSSDTKVFL